MKENKTKEEKQKKGEYKLKSNNEDPNIKFVATNLIF